MTYDEIAKASETLGYRDKLRLAQLLVQLARKEEEEQNPQRRTKVDTSSEDVIEYVAARLRKLRPGKKDGVLNSIGAMFQFQGGVSDSDKEALFAQLQRTHRLKIDGNGRVSYPE